MSLIFIHILTQRRFSMQERYATLDRRRKALLKKIARLGPWIMGTPTITHNKSTRTGRREAGFAEKLYLTFSEAGGRNGSTYVPVGMREEVLEWVENYTTMKEYMREMTELSRKMIRLYTKSKKPRKAQKS